MIVGQYHVITNRKNAIYVFVKEYSLIIHDLKIDRGIFVVINIKAWNWGLFSWTPSILLIFSI